MGDQMKPTVGSPSISDVNQLLEKLLLKELPLKKNGVDISFDQPTRDWSGRLSGPTINLFLHDLRRNKYRQAQWETSSRGRAGVVRQRPPIKLDLRYIVTAWVIDGEPEEEHYLLTAIFLALSRHPLIPDTSNNVSLPEDSIITTDFLPEVLQKQPAPLAISIADPEDLIDPADIWSSLDNDLRPTLVCTVTFAVDPYAPIEVPIVTRRELRARTVGHDEVETNLSHPHYNIQGVINSDTSLEDVRLYLAGRAQYNRDLFVPVVSDETSTEHTFTLPFLRIGSYDLVVFSQDRPPVSFNFSLPILETAKQNQKGGLSFQINVDEEIHTR